MERIRALHVEGRAADNGMYYVHCGDLDWWFNKPPDEAERRVNIRLWEDGTRLIGWCLHLLDGHEFDFFAHPSERGRARAQAMLSQGVDWALERTRSRGGQKLTHGWVSQTDTVSLAMWQACGFAASPQPEGPIFLQSLARELEAPALPQGFTIGDARTEADLRLRLEATHGAFGIERPWDAYWQKNLAIFYSPVYVGEHNLFVRSPDGHGAAACTIWLDPVNKVGLFEPVGTHPAYQKRGLGRAVMREGLARMKAAGMTHASVGTNADNVAAIALYCSLGFQERWMSANLVKNV